MDLLAPCRSCLHCLPFFRVSSPPLLTATATATALPSSSTSLSVVETEEKSASSETTSASVQQQDLPLSELKTELCTSSVDPSQAPIESVDGKNEESQEKTGDPLEEHRAAPAISEIIIAPPVTSNEALFLPEIPETTKTTIASELPLQVPFINDVSFSTGGLMLLPSPATPMPIGSGYTEHEHGHPHHGHGHPHHADHHHGHTHHGHGHHL